MDPYKSALKLLPIVFERLGGPPATVADVGCNDGSWLRAATELGVSRVMGLDAFESTHMQIPASASLTIVDLNNLDPIDPLAFAPGSLLSMIPFDLVLCLETAEHLKPASAEALVELVDQLAGSRLGSSILWSAAIPGQGPYGEEDNPGVHHNEQEPEYWEDQFLARGYRIDRTTSEKLRAVKDVDPWYRSSVVLLTRGLTETAI